MTLFPFSIPGLYKETVEKAMISGYNRERKGAAPVYESIVRLDLHGKNAYQARVALDAALRRAKGGTYRIRCIHGCHGGTVLRDMIRGE